MPANRPSLRLAAHSSLGPPTGRHAGKSAPTCSHYDEPEPEVRIDLGSEIVLVRTTRVRRGRPRRGPLAGDRPFDARQIFLSDHNRPHSDRRTVALIMELTQLLSAPPSFWDDQNERSYDLQAVQDQLRHRGMDVEALIRYGIGPSIEVSLAGYALIPLIKDDERVTELVERLEEIVPEFPPDWQKFFSHAYERDVRDHDEDAHSKMRYGLGGFLIRVGQWLAHASLDDILAWRAPEVSDTCADDHAADRDGRETARWITDRFTKLDLCDWSVSSLHLEWLYLYGRIPAPCSNTAMAERRVSATDVSSALAHETTSKWRSSRDGEGSPSDAGKFVRIAADHLRNGKPELAAAIFEALTNVNQNDAEALNDYGFCLLKVDAQAALEVLERSGGIYRGRNLVNLANRVLALHLLNRTEDAYALAVAEATRVLPSERALMWILDEDHYLQLSDADVDVRGYLNNLVAHIDAGCDAACQSAAAS